MNLKESIRLLKTSPWLRPVLLAIDAVLWLVDTIAILSTRRQKSDESVLAILKFDALGDYLMLRAYVRYLRTHPDYQSYTFCLVGNTAFRQMAEFADADLFNSFVWIDIYRLSTQPLYRFQTASELRKRDFAVTINPTRSRVLVLDDFMTRVCGAPARIGCVTDLTNTTETEARWGDTYFTRLLPTDTAVVFEAERNRQLFSRLLDTSLSLLPMQLPAVSVGRLTLPDRFMILSPGAGAPDKIWPMARFAEVLAFLHELRPELTMLVTGTASESYLYEQLQASLPPDTPVQSLVGKLSQGELIGAVRKAELVLANDSGIVHIAAAVGTPCLSLSAGKSIVRWHPYPAAIAPQIRHVYPAFFDDWMHRLPELAPAVAAEAPVPVDSLDVDRVKQALRQLLTDIDQRFTNPISVK
ncbi:glycosyltransferase family 9 protein [Spirosoma rhododendri]|uniref:Glycosyltransferase family 9 protein n=1 Tax=Spirosoma rhododendri TaxID=2728024 RepID=A0A7L5DN96_9BACT|nr:glycosyltransferase family 9 protein [Spirosoma rhododendri]QJD78683.1 glycosyltransferase family 9 protein [Spirosoma rhododendri]